MVYTPEEEEKWAEGEVKVIDGKTYKVSYLPYTCGDVEMLLKDIEASIGRDKMAKLFGIRKGQYTGIIYNSDHDCFLIEKREHIE